MTERTHFLEATARPTAHGVGHTMISLVLPAGFVEGQEPVLAYFPSELMKKLHEQAGEAGRTPADELLLAVQIHCGQADPAARFPQLALERVERAIQELDEGKGIPLKEAMAKARARLGR